MNDSDLRAFLSQFPSNVLLESPSATTLLICNVCQKQYFSRNGKRQCKTCKEFFRRCVMKNLSLKCNFKGKCDVHHSLKQIQCRSCRLKKCLESGLNAKDFRPTQVTRPNLKVQEINAVQRLELSRLSFTEKNMMNVTESDNNKNVQFLNMTQVIENFLPDILEWAKQSELFGELNQNEKIELIQSQWIRILLVKICENNAHLLDFDEDLSSVLHAYHSLGISNQEAFWIKNIILFMMTKADKSYCHPLHLNDLIAELFTLSVLGGTCPVRFAEIMTWIGTLTKISLGGVQSKYQQKVREMVYLCL
ncbi:hypothetical protein GCK72_006056 [Caenorhabditis remanei]|uniref:Nuclear receptor domain-containing protein n=1 Tax=Caenorhabditis remanei TaxID=31234 RepID=A0A6A5HE80_CAERE|nr:hypothetical protein GCK72_006056 [Caenorhabditis remanei]KAF1766100.1 hypothetical protein GCK72_006056 [Caenorhabditis remanei]